MKIEMGPVDAIERPARPVKPRARPAAKAPAPGLVEDALMCGSLRKIVAGLSLDPVLQQDMLQECLVCLWRVESEKPGRTRSCSSSSRRTTTT